MKDLLKNGVLVVLIIGLLYMIFLRECKTTTCPPEGSILVTESFIDSLQKEASKPPIIIIHDTIIYRDTIIYLNKPTPLPIDSIGNLSMYRDSIYNDSIRVWTEFAIYGKLERFNQWYQPITLLREITKEVIKPYPVPYEVPVSKAGFYISGIVGGNMDSFTLGAGLDYITKKDYLYGVQYQRWGDINIYEVKVGFKIKFKK